MPLEGFWEFRSCSELATSEPENAPLSIAIQEKSAFRGWLSVVPILKLSLLRKLVNVKCKVL
jgi:hypothetical protein